MDKIFKKFHEFSIFSNNEVDHINHQVSFAKKYEKHGMLLFKKKLKIMKPRIKFIGLIRDETRIEMQHHIYEKIYLFSKKLESKEHIKKNLGCLNYTECFIENLANERQILQGLLKKNNTKSWEDRHTNVVNSLKEKCKYLPRLGFSTTSNNLIIETDA